MWWGKGLGWGDGLGWWGVAGWGLGVGGVRWGEGLGRVRGWPLVGWANGMGTANLPQMIRGKLRRCQKTRSTASVSRPLQTKRRFLYTAKWKRTNKNKNERVSKWKEPERRRGQQPQESACPHCPGNEVAHCPLRRHTRWSPLFRGRPKRQPIPWRSVAFVKSYYSTIQSLPESCSVGTSACGSCFAVHLPSAAFPSTTHPAPTERTARPSRRSSSLPRTCRQELALSFSLGIRVPVGRMNWVMNWVVKRHRSKLQWPRDARSKQCSY